MKIKIDVNPTSGMQYDGFSELIEVEQVGIHPYDPKCVIILVPDRYKWGWPIRTDDNNVPEEYIGKLGWYAHPVIDQALVSSNLAPAINNHTCVYCGNDKCGKQEKSCWKCGGKIQS